MLASEHVAHVATARSAAPSSSSIPRRAHRKDALRRALRGEAQRVAIARAWPWSRTLDGRATASLDPAARSSSRDARQTDEGGRTVVTTQDDT